MLVNEQDIILDVLDELWLKEGNLTNEEVLELHFELTLKATNALMNLLYRMRGVNLTKTFKDLLTYESCYDNNQDYSILAKEIESKHLYTSLVGFEAYKAYCSFLKLTLEELENRFTILEEKKIKGWVTALENSIFE